MCVQSDLDLVEIIKNFGYLGAFLSGFLGSSSLFVSVFPSYIVVSIIATQLNPFLVGIMAGIGAGMGQYLHYYIGTAGRVVLLNKHLKIFEIFRKKLEKYGLIAIFIFAATPLTPDDIIWIPLGVMKYPRFKAFLAGIAGKILLNIVYAFFGYYIINNLVRYF